MDSKWVVHKPYPSAGNISKEAFTNLLTLANQCTSKLF